MKVLRPHRTAITKTLHEIVLQKHFGNCPEGEIKDDTHVSGWIPVS